QGLLPDRTIFWRRHGACGAARFQAKAVVHAESRQFASRLIKSRRFGEPKRREKYSLYFLATGASVAASMTSVAVSARCVRAACCIDSIASLVMRSENY